MHASLERYKAGYALFKMDCLHTSPWRNRLARSAVNVNVTERLVVQAHPGTLFSFNLWDSKRIACSLNCDILQGIA